jgi:PAS domain S-box-containing protein
LVLQTAYSLFYGYAVAELYPLLLALNPAPWAADAVTSIPDFVLRAIGIKSGLLLLLLTFGASVLLRTPRVRWLLGLPISERTRDHGWILLGSLGGALTMWWAFLLLDYVLIGSNAGNGILEARAAHQVLALLVLLAMGLVTAQVVMSDVERRQEADERRHASDREVAAERERLAVTLRSIGDGVITTDTQGRVVLINNIAEQMTGWDQAEAAGRPLFDVFRIVNEETRKICENPVEKVLATGQIIELANHTLLIHRDGTERVIADSGAPIRDESGAILGVVLVFRDTTEKLKLAEAMQRADKLEALGVLAGGIAHDFNNLLSGILGYVELARMQCEPSSPIAELLDQSLAASGRARGLTQQLLIFAKGGAPTREIGNLGTLLRENAAFALSGSSVACEFAIEPGLWPCSFDVGQIGQVVDNLVINGMQAMPTGGILQISARNREITAGEASGLLAGRYVEFAVTDAGVGVPPELRRRIFDPFFTTKPSGNGLGLATCHTIIQKHDGRIVVDSEVGRGSTFRVLLPASAGLPAIAAKAASQALFCGEGRILVMDDEPMLRGIVSEMLKSLGYKVETASHGQEAVELCERARLKGERFDAALFDLTIPGGMGGEEALRRVAAHCPEFPVFAMSGYSESPIMANPTEHGFRASIRKPFRVAELSELLTRHLGGA